MTPWPEAVAWMVIAPCCLLAWVAWLKWGQRRDTPTDTVLKSYEEPTYRTSTTYTNCTCPSPCSLHPAVTSQSDVEGGSDA